MVLSKDCNCAVRKSEAAKFSHFNPVLFCVWEDLAFLIVDFSFHGQGHLLQIPRRPPCSDGLVCLGSHPGLANCKGASIEGVIVARCTGCSSKLCLLIGPFELRSLQQRRLHKHYKFGTATSYHGLKWS